LLEATYAHKLAETEARLKVETKALQKKVTLAEKSIKEKLKSIQKQSQIEEREILTSSTA
jgi:hypothetical protein